MQEEGVTAALADRPDHVPEALVVDFNMYSVPGGTADAQAAFLRYAAPAHQY